MRRQRRGRPVGEQIDAEPRDLARVGGQEERHLVGAIVGTVAATRVALTGGKRGLTLIPTGWLGVALGVDVLVAVGPGARPAADAARAAGVTAVETPDPEAARGYVITAVRRGDAVLVKASRPVGLEAVAAALTEPAR